MVKRKISNFIETLKEKNYHGHVTAHDNLHITLHYLGETNKNKLVKVIKELNNISVDSFIIKTNSIKAFKKNQNKKILYLSINNSQDLSLLHKEVINRLNTVGYNINVQNYTPHITLMKKVVTRNDIIEKFEFKPFEIKVNSISVMESKRIDGELVYEELKRIVL